MKKQLIISTGMSAILALSIAQPVFAFSDTTTIMDNYIGGNDWGRGDVIGYKSKFDVISMDVGLTGNLLSVTINTNFAGRSGVYGSFTNTAASQGRGIAYGDLFLSNAWNPYGAPAYVNDNSSNGTVWSHAFALDDRWNNDAGALGAAGTLYSLTGDDSDTLLSEDFLSAGIFRNGQEVAVDASQKGDADTVGTGRWGTENDTRSTVGKINFLIDLTGTSLAGSDTIALHWGMTCGNDTIEGEYSVPEPAILGLVALGLIGIGVSQRKKAKV